MIVVQYIPPSLRVAVAKELVDGLGLRKNKAAEKMNVTSSAITQYLNKSRGEKAIEVIEGSDRIKDLLSDLAEDLMKVNGARLDLVLLQSRKPDKIDSDAYRNTDDCDTYKEAAHKEPG